MKIGKLSLVASMILVANAEVKDLGEIIVSTVSKTEQSIKEITTNINVISGDELEEREILTVVEALNLVSGISFSSNGGLGSPTAINLRGSDNKRVLVLIDGIRYKDHSDISGTDISHLMINDIDRIEVIKGAQSGIWGADSSAGVINIITKKIKKGFYSTILAEYGSFNTKKYGATISYRENKFDIKLNGQRVSSDSFTTKAPNGENIDKYEDDSYSNNSINLKGNYYINDDTKIGLTLQTIDAKKEYDVSDANDTTMKNDVDTDVYNLSFHQNYNNHNFIVKYNQSEIKRDQIGTTWGVKLTDNSHKDIELTDKISYNSNDFILLGGGLQKDDLEYIQADGIKKDGESKSKFLFVTNSNTFDKIILTQSIRYDDYDNFDNKSTGKIGAKYNIAKKINIFSNIGTSYTTPALIQNINPWGAENYDIIPEEGRTFDIGFRYKDLKFTYFYHQINDLIDWYDATPENYYDNNAIYTNLDGENIFKGIELEYQREIIEDTFLLLSYTKLSACDKDKNDLQKRVKESLKFGIDYYGIEKFHFGLNGEYVGDREENDFTSSEMKQTGKYTLANFILNYEINDDIKIYSKIDNITDKYYQSSYGYASSPRTYSIGIRATF